MMRVIIRLSVLVVLFGGVNSAVAQTCNSYIGQAIKSTSFDAVEKLLSKIPSEKGEFQTTADFEEKVAAIRSTWPESFLISYTFGERGEKLL